MSSGVYCVPVRRRVMTAGKVDRGDGYDVTLLRLAVWPAVEKFQTPNRRNQSRVLRRICYDRCTTLVSEVLAGREDTLELVTLPLKGL